MLCTNNVNNRGEVGGDAPQVDARGALMQHYGIQHEKRGGERLEEKVHGFKLKEQPSKGDNQMSPGTYSWITLRSHPDYSLIILG